MDLVMMTFIALIVVGYIFLYTSNKLYLREGFGEPINTGELRKPCKKSNVILEQNLDAPWVKRDILSVDDYEYNLIFQNEGDREMTKALQNKLQSQYPMDWSVQPPSSSQFQAGLKRLHESFQSPPAQTPGVDPYKEITEEALTPEDTSKVAMEERKILQLYKPASTDSLKTYSLDDAQELIKKIYDAKGLIPEVIKKDNNVFEIVGTRRKDEKIVYEDPEAPAQRAPTASAGEATITVPAVATDVAAGLDPFFTPSPSTHIDKWDYNKFTPGLERMFAPTYPTVEWY
jgi:hypothetical protein